MRLFYIYKQWKFRAALTVLKPDKDGTKPTSYRSVILLSTTAKLFEKLVLFRISKKIYRKNNNILQHQYGLIKRLSIDQQIHRIVNVIKNEFKNKIYRYLSTSEGFPQNVTQSLIVHVEDIAS